MQGFDKIIEERIAAAQRRGELEVPELAGKPLPADDLLVPAEQRMAMKILRNAGLLPPEIQQLREAEGLLAACSGGDGEAQRAARRRLEFLMARLEADGRPALSRALLARYRAALLERMQGQPGKS